MMEARSPFKFLDSYGKPDREIFFGRDTEIEELYSKVFQGRLLLVYGASGTGKSSIINCGLANKFQESDWFPIHIRRGNNINTSLMSEIGKARSGTPQEITSSDVREEISDALENVYLDHFKPVFLIFDQFEELFIFGQKDEWKEFISIVNHIMSADNNVRFLFVIRGEYLEYLSEFEEVIPEFFDNRIRIEKMTRQKAMECVEGPCDVSNIHLEENFVENLLKKLSPDKSEIELTFLQVYLDRIFHSAETKVNGVTTTYFTNKQIEELGEIGDVLADFLDAQIYESSDPELTQSVLKSFVSLEGTKSRNTIEEVILFTESIGVKVPNEKVESIIHDLVNRRILTDKDEAGQYELRHDSLAQKIYEKITQQERELIDVKTFLNHSFNEYSKRGALLDDNDLAYVSLYEKNLVLGEDLTRFLEESKKNSKKKKRSRIRFIVILTIIVLLLITSALGFFNSQRQKAKAEEMATVAQEESQRAKELQGQAENQKSIAESSAEEAQRQSAIALQERSKAEEARLEAENQRRSAIDAQQLALTEAERARQARNQAEINAREAETQKSIADEERTIAERLYMLALARTMGIKSTQVNDKELSALIALQAYTFNQRFGGNKYQPEIYTALYEATQRYLGVDYNSGNVHSGSVKAIVTQGDLSYSTGSDGEILQWTHTNHRLSSKKLASTGQINLRIAASSDGKYVLTGTDEGYVFLISAMDGSILFSEKRVEGDITAVSFIDDQSFIYTGETGKIYLHNASGTNLLFDLKQKINGMSMHPLNGNLLLATSSGQIMELTSDKQTSLIYSEKDTPVTSITINHDGKLAAFGFEDGKLMLWNLEGGDVLANLTGHTAAVSDVNFNKDSRFLVSSSFDRSVRVWKLDQLQEQPIVLANQGSWISSAGFSSDNRGIIVGEFDRKIRFYPLEMSEYVSELCKQMKRSMTLEEWEEFVDEKIEYEPTCNSGN